MSGELAMEAPQRGFDPWAYVLILKRRYLYLLVPAVLGFGVAAWYAHGLPPEYEATAKILVESQQIPTELAQPTVTANAAERIQVIEQRLTTRDNLLAIADKFHLYADAAHKMSPSEIVDVMRGAARIEQIDLQQRNRPDTLTIGFTVTFDYYDPMLTANVTNEFVTSILEQNIESRTKRAEETRKFFETQVDKLAQDLAAQETAIVAFKDNNQAALPETLASRRLLLSQLQDQLATVTDKITALQVERGLASQRGALGLDPNADTTQAELAKLRTKLVQLRAVYSDTHPEVRAVKAQISALEKATEGTPQKSGGQVGNDPTGGSSGSSQLAAIDGQLKMLLGQQAEISRRSAVVDETIKKTPEIDAALSALIRDHDAIQLQYSQTKAKAAEAVTGVQLEQDRQAERFEVVEQAAVPNQPAKPNRKKIVMTGGLGSLGAGAALVMLLESLRKGIRTTADLEKWLQMRPIATIPYVTTIAERKRKKRLLKFLVIAVAGAAIVGLVLLQAYYLPLDLVAAKIFGRLGF